MKKLGFIVMPLMTISLLASCGGDNPGPTPVDTTYTLTFNCKNCKAFDENENELSTIEITIPSDHSKVVYQSFYFKRIEPYKTPLKSSISVVNADSFEPVEFEYHNGMVTVPVIGNLAITANGTQFSKNLENSSWDEIREISNTGHPEEFFAVGNTKKVQLEHQDSKGDGTDVISDSELYQTVRIIDFNHDYSELPDDGSDPDPSKVLGITFEFANVITKFDGNVATTIWDGEYQVSGNNYDYRKSVLNTFLNNDVLNMLPSSSDPSNPNLKDVIKPVDKKVGISTDEGKTYTATSFNGSDDYPYPYLFPLAHDEITSETSTCATANEGKIYQYYSEHSSQEDRIKRKAGIDSGNGESYWFRSPDTSFSRYAWSVDGSGLLCNFNVFVRAFAVTPAFCI